MSGRSAICENFVKVYPKFLIDSTVFGLSKYSFSHGLGFPSRDGDAKRGVFRGLRGDILEGFE